MQNPEFSSRAVRTALWVSLAIAGLWFPAASLAAPKGTSEIDPADTSSPRATLKSFIDACNRLHRKIESEHYFDRTSPEHHPIALKILDCLDVSELPEYEQVEFAGEAAVCIKEILDRVELPRYDEIPDAEEIESADEEKNILRWPIPGTRLTITKVEEGLHRHEYLFSPDSVSHAPDVYADIRLLPYRKTGPDVSPGFHRWYVSAPGRPIVAKFVDALPDWFRERTQGLSHWQWFGLTLAIILALLFLGVSYKLHFRLARKYRGKSLLGFCLTIVFPISYVLIPMGLKFVATEYLTIKGTPLYFISFLCNVTSLLAAMFVVFGTGNRIASSIIASPQINPQGLDAQFIRIVTKLLSGVVAVIVFLEGGNYLGFPLTTLIASAGIGGLAVALAAQDAIKNLFGTIMLLTDKPFRVGERIIFDKYDGTIEDIGLRSTRIRLLNGNQVTIPNDKLASSDIENVGRRSHIRRVSDIHIPLDTPRENLEKAMAVIRAALEGHEGMDPEQPPRVFFYDFNPSAFVIRIIYWYNATQYWDFLALGEKINFEVFRAFEEQGISFSLPFRVAHISDGREENRSSPI